MPSTECQEANLNKLSVNDGHISGVSWEEEGAGGEGGDEGKCDRGAVMSNWRQRRIANVPAVFVLK